MRGHVKLMSQHSSVSTSTPLVKAELGLESLTFLTPKIFVIYGRFTFASYLLVLLECSHENTLSIYGLKQDGALLVKMS